jgi:hypothetical protein
MKSIEEKITYFPFLGVGGGIALCKKHEVQYIKEIPFPLLDIIMKAKSGNMPCKYCLEESS